MNKANTLNSHKTIRIKGRLIDLSTPKVMGIINLTPDSFYTGSRKSDPDTILDAASQMVADGADFLDIGGYSSRPGANDVSPEEELKRVVEPIRMIRDNHPEAVISIDTFRAGVAERAIEAGADIINDISGGDLDPNMHELIARLQVPYIVMHMRGTPQTMNMKNTYQNVTIEVLKDLSEKIQRLESLGIHDLIVDPGFGFAKDVEQNFRLLNEFEQFVLLDKPLLAGLSRKSMIWKTLRIEPEEALNGTTVLNTVALLKGANILRVHDVKEAKEAAALFSKIKS